MPDPKRQFSTLDKWLIQLNEALATIATEHVAQRPYPADEVEETHMSVEQRQHAAGLMRVNHAGEICAQALYKGQASTAVLNDVREQMEEAAQEEVDHLAWCETRLMELSDKPSVLNPIWYAGSFLIGALAGRVGDQWSLGFVMETEKQVVAHLRAHLERLPEQDHKTRAVIEQMTSDEAQHALMAEQAGGAELPMPIRWLMRLTSKVMTTLAYRV